MWHPAILTLLISLVCEKAAAAERKCKFNTIQDGWKLWDTCYLEISGKKRYKAKDGKYYLEHADGTYVWTKDGTTEPECYEGAWKITPHIPRSEYCQPVFFHTMIKGYARRVNDPADADLFYVPIYSERLKCHPDANDWGALLRRIANLVGKWIARFPAKDGMGPNFFTAAGQVCSCAEPRRNHLCNPVTANQSLDDKVLTVAWESPVPSLVRSMPNVVVPYISTLHDILPWRVDQQRGLLVTMTAKPRPTDCTYCGPCSGKPATADTCVCGCNNRRRELRKMFHDAWDPAGSDILMLEGFKGWSSQDRHQMKLNSTFCVEPFGDTVTRKSFYESIMLGCIPVVSRQDSLYLDQLPFSHTIPYRQLFVAIPPGTTDIFAMLRAISKDDIIRRRRVIKRYGRRLTFSSNSSQHGGYNDLGRPDAFASALKEVWDRSKQPKHRSHLVSPATSASPVARCEQKKKDKYTDVGANNVTNYRNETSDYPKVYVLPLPAEFNDNLLKCTSNLAPHAKKDDAQMFARTSPALPFGITENFLKQSYFNFYTEA